MKAFATPVPLLQRLWLLYVAALLCACAHAQPSAGLQSVRQMNGVSELALPNGLQVLLAPDATSAVTSVNITYRVGSRHEGIGEHGAAHLLEHMLFKASGDIADPKREMGSRAMRWNGTTSEDRTNYFANFGPDDDKLRWMMRWLATMMTQARFTRADLDSEMTVVRNEWERAQGNTGGLLGERMRQAAYTWHGYGRAVIGARSDIENVSIERLYSFYRQHYRPDNATLIITGRFDIAAAKSAIEQHFGPIAKPGMALPSSYTLEEPQDGERSVTLRRAGGAGSVAVLYHMPSGSTRAGAAASLLAEVLRQRGGPLQRGVSGAGLSVSEFAFFRELHDPGYLVAGVSLPTPGTATSASTGSGTGADLLAVRAAAGLAAVLENLTISPEEVDTARQTLLSGYRASLRDSERVASVLSGAVALGDWRLGFVKADWLQAVTVDEVRDIARRYLLPSNRTTGSFLPLAENATVARAPAPVPSNATNTIATEALNTGASSPNVAAVSVDDPVARTANTLSYEAFDLTPLVVQSRLQTATLQVGGKPGLQLAVLPRAAKDDRVQGLLRLRWGSAQSLNGQAVLASMAGALLQEGSLAIALGGVQRPALDGAQVRRSLQNMDARLSISTSAGRLVASFEYPVNQHTAFMALLTQVVRAPSFPAAAFERHQKMMLANIQGQSANTASLAAQALDKSYADYPEGDPRQTRTPAQTQQLTQATTAELLRAHWQRFASASDGEMVLAGPLKVADLQGPLQSAWGDWSSREPQQNWSRQHSKPTGALWQTVNVPDASNASYNARLALPLSEQDADYPALALGVQLLSRSGLWQRVREREGLSYSVGASLAVPSEGDAASINISASFAPANLQRLRQAVRTELQLRSKQGFSESEVSSIKAAALTARRDAYARLSNAMANIATNLQYQRPMSYDIQRSTAIEALDVATVNRVLQKYLQLDQLVEVAAGSF